VTPTHVLGTAQLDSEGQAACPACAQNLFRVTTKLLLFLPLVIPFSVLMHIFEKEYRDRGLCQHRLPSALPLCWSDHKLCLHTLVTHPWFSFNLRLTTLLFSLL
jgi:hypothetical protein